MKFIADVSLGKCLVNSKYVIFVYVLCYQYKYNIFSLKKQNKNKTKIDNFVVF